MRTGVSQKKTERHAERCDSCGLWFEFLHPSADGRFLCRMCLTLEGGNRAAPLQPVTRRKTDWGWLLQPSRRGGGMDCSGSRSRPWVSLPSRSDTVAPIILRRSCAVLARQSLRLPRHRGPRSRRRTGRLRSRPRSPLAVPPRTPIAAEDSTTLSKAVPRRMGVVQTRQCPASEHLSHPDPRRTANSRPGTRCGSHPRTKPGLVRRRLPAGVQSHRRL
jgi:hypothetical protein